LPRVKRGVIARRKHSKVLELTKGQRMTRRTLFRRANEAMLHSLTYAYFHRRERKADMRKLWITRINAASRAEGIEYNQLIHGLKLSGININRKMLADMAVREPEAFNNLVTLAKNKLTTSLV